MLGTLGSFILAYVCGYEYHEWNWTITISTFVISEFSVYIVDTIYAAIVEILANQEKILEKINDGINKVNIL